MRNSKAVDCILVHIPKLDRMDINVYGNQHDKLATVLQLNPQLRRLSIFGNGLNLKFLRSLSKCPQLEILFLIHVEISLTSKIQPIHFKYVRKFGINSFDLQKFDEANISITFDQLEELILGQLNLNIFHQQQSNHIGIQVHANGIVWSNERRYQIEIGENTSISNGSAFWADETFS